MSTTLQYCRNAEQQKSSKLNSPALQCCISAALHLAATNIITYRSRAVRTLVIGGGKGGPGKTTVALNIACAAALQGCRTACFDVDTQQSLSLWFKVRKKLHPTHKLPVVEREFVSDLEEAMGRAQDNRADLVIVDTPGKADSELMTAAELADLVLMPTVPSLFDLDATVRTHKRISKVCEPPVVLLTRSDWRGPEREVAREKLEGRSIKVLTSSIGDLKAFRRSVDEGLGVVELPRSSSNNTAHQQVLELAEEVFGLLGLEWKL